MKPRILVRVVASEAPVIIIAPTTEIAEMALVSDISGVWRRGETFRMISRPTNVASMNTNNPSSKLEGMRAPSGRLQADQLAHFGMHHFARVSHECLTDDLVFAVEC